jgi:hypothetical protein
MSNWNENTEAVVKNIRDICKTNRIMHISAANESKRMYNILTLSGMVIGPIAGVLAGTREIVCDASHVGNSAVIILSLVSSLIMSVVKFGNLDEMVHLNKEASSSYHMIQNNADLQLLREVDRRTDATEYIEWLQAKFEDTFEKSPLLNKNNYTEERRRNSIRITDVQNNIKEDSDDSETSSNQIPSIDRVLQYELNRMSRV